jgi:hypothetical protein
MTRILLLLQIKTVRSAWVFLIGSGAVFLFVVYLNSPYSSSRSSESSFSVIFDIALFLITGAYTAIASWALFSEEGRAFLTTQEQIPIKGNRTVLWYIKFLFACYAAGIASAMFLSVVALPIVGYDGIEAMFSKQGLLYILLVSLLWSPLIFRYLK